MKGELETYVTIHGKWTIVEIHSNVRLFGTCEQTYHPTVAEILIKRCILAQSKQYFTSQLVESDIFVKLINTYYLDLEASPGLLQSNPECSIERAFPK